MLIDAKCSYFFPTKTYLLLQIKPKIHHSIWNSFWYSLFMFSMALNVPACFHVLNTHTDMTLNPKQPMKQWKILYDLCAHHSSEGIDLLVLDLWLQTSTGFLSAVLCLNCWGWHWEFEYSFFWNLCRRILSKTRENESLVLLERNKDLYRIYIYLYIDR